jgi:hypothetical protein
MVQARNSIGFSLWSTQVSVLVAQIPNVPSAPVTQTNGNFVNITWALPGDGNSPIIGYKIEVRQSDNITFTENLLSCNGLNA